MYASAQNALEAKGMIEMSVYFLPDKHSKYLARQRQSRSGLFFGWHCSDNRRRRYGTTCAPGRQPSAKPPETEESWDDEGGSLLKATK